MFRKTDASAPLACLGIIAFVTLCSLVSGWIFMLLWNWVIAGVFKAPVLTIWHALGILLLLGSVKGTVSGSKSS